MLLIIGAIFVVLVVFRFGLTLLGFKVKPILPARGRSRYYADLAIIAMLLLMAAILAGLPRSFGTALAIVVIATLVATVLDMRRK
ncbi:MAG: hypothetical protein WDN69_29400, partial [Aliidongia sp.]